MDLGGTVVDDFSADLVDGAAGAFCAGLVDFEATLAVLADSFVSVVRLRGLAVIAAAVVDFPRTEDGAGRDGDPSFDEKRFSRCSLVAALRARIRCALAESG